MYRDHKFWLLAAFLGCLARAAAEPALDLESTDRPFDVVCKSWFNAQPIDFFEHPRAILLAFWSVRSPACRALVGPLNRLRASYGGRLEVVGVTEDGSREVRWYIERYRPRYKIGAEWHKTPASKVSELPALLLIDTSQRRIVWRGSGDEADSKAVGKAVEGFVGSPDGKDRSAKLLAEEKADTSVYWARLQRNEARIEALVSGALAAAPEGTYLEAEDLDELDRYYEQKLPSDPDGPEAWSEDAARAEVCGFETGYGALLKSGRLSADGVAQIYGRLLSIAASDPSQYVRLGAVHTLRRSVGENAEPDMIRQLKDLLEVESEGFARGALQLAIDQLDPQSPPEIRAELARPTLGRLHRMMRSAPSSSHRWADARSYMEAVKDRDSPGLIEDYWAYPDTQEDGAARENAKLKRNAAVGELGARIVRGEVGDTQELQSSLADMLLQEPDPWIRSSIAEYLFNLGKRGNGDDRNRIIKVLEAQLAVETHAYHVRPGLEMFIKLLRSQQ